MNELINFWNIIVESNTFNFVVLLLIFAILYRKLNVSNAVEKIKQGIVKTIEDAKSEKESAENKLKDAQKAIENLDDDIKSRIDDAKLRAEGIAKQILTNADSRVKLIEKNIGRVISAEEKTLSTKMSEKTLKTSVELARQHIINMLENNKDFHNKFIDESIENIDKV